MDPEEPQVPSTAAPVPAPAAVEDQPKIENAVLNEEIEDSEAETKTVLDKDKDDDPEPEPMSIELDPSEQLSYLEAEAMIDSLKKNCKNLGVPEEQSIHLDRFSRALQLAKGTKAAKKKDSTMHDFFQKKK